MLTLATVETAARELASVRAREVPRVKVALWAAILSANKPLSWNAAQVQALRGYVDCWGTLPDDPLLVWDILRSGHRFASRAEARRVLAVELADRRGLLAGWERKPETLAQWWQRRRVFAAFEGLSWKTATFALWLLWPLECPLVPVDTHVCARLGVSREEYKRLSRKTDTGYARYYAVEKQVRDEWDKAGRPVPLSVWHWWTWEQWRQLTGKATLSDTPESHWGLSPYL